MSADRRDSRAGNRLASPGDLAGAFVDHGSSAVALEYAGRRPERPIPAPIAQAGACPWVRSKSIMRRTRCYHARPLRCPAQPPSTSSMQARRVLSTLGDGGRCRPSGGAVQWLRVDASLSAPGGLSKENFAQVVLQEKRVRHPQRRKQPDDVAVQQNRLAASHAPGYGTVLQVHVVHDDVLRVERCRAAAPCRRSRAARRRAAARAPADR